jgi:hypothetical protein
MSPKQRRTDAITRRFPAWYLTDGKTSQALHIGAAFRHLNELARTRARWPFLTKADREWNIARLVPSEIAASRFNLSLYPNRLPS